MLVWHDQEELQEIKYPWHINCYTCLYNVVRCDQEELQEQVACDIYTHIYMRLYIYLSV